ncbi:MAG TPA: ABC transporter ATP-binding protein [Candidatus Thermoplasmatota archaeon]|nr:ABC transporter ATP-binding protein [Candidatus Thermoplasmatota archaeon]
MTLEVQGVHASFPGWPPTLRGASLRLGRGESGFLLGPSGSGKSTLLRCIAGLHRPDAGSIRWDGEDLVPLPPHRRGVGMLFQDAALFPHLRAWQNVAFGLKYRGVPRREWRTEAEHWLAVCAFPGRGDARPHELSGGERQRVALARTLAARPRVVLLDEPLSALDRDLRDELGGRLRGILREQQVAALWVTHDRDEAFRLGDKVWALRDGVLDDAAPAGPAARHPAPARSGEP